MDLERLSFANNRHVRVLSRRVDSVDQLKYIGCEELRYIRRGDGGSLIKCAWGCHGVGRRLMVVKRFDSVA